MLSLQQYYYSAYYYNIPMFLQLQGVVESIPHTVLTPLHPNPHSLLLQGVVDSEDVPLNLSRELLQESVIINKIKSVITAKMISYLNRQV